MPAGGYTCLPHDRLMTAEEIETIAAEFVRLGINKIRLTGGEPLVRKDFADIVERLSKLKVELLLTTNGALIHQYVAVLKAAGIHTVNVSLDSLNRRTFCSITGRDVFDRVWSNIMLLLQNGFHVKLNVVAIRGCVEKELADFILLTKKLPLHVRFIEFMPFAGNRWSSSKVITAGEMLQQAAGEFDIVKLKDEPHATAKKYMGIGHKGTFAFITTMSDQFCSECNRLRLTAEGKLKNCLFGKEELDLLGALRKGELLTPLIRQSVSRKFKAMGGQFEKGYEHTDGNTVFNRSMVGIGG
jgi:cyclic pyranopterin phosphate synthase